MPKKKAPCKCLSIIMLDSVIKAKKKSYPQTLLEECKYEQDKNGEPYWWWFRKNCLISITVNLIKIMMNLMNSLLKAKNVF